MMSLTEQFDSHIHKLHTAETSAHVRESTTQICEMLLKNSILLIAEIPHLICEVEVYVNKKGVHEDTFTHAHKDQRSSMGWYFHKRGSTFREGTYKGVDLTLGNGDNLAAGILIRMIRPLQIDDEHLQEAGPPPTEGPSLVVDQILKLNKCGSILQFVDANNVKNARECTGLRLIHNCNPAEAFRTLRAPRVGLTLKNPSHLRWIAKRYRFATAQCVPAKIRVGFVAVLIFEAERTFDEIAEMSGVTKKKVEQWAKIVKAPCEGEGEIHWIYNADVRKVETVCKIVNAFDAEI